MDFTYKVDRISLEIGMINCFVEMVSCGVKPLAISPPISPEDLDVLVAASEEISNGYHTKCVTVDSLMITDIQSAEFTKGKRSILYYAADAVIEEYYAMDKRVKELVANGEYTGKVRRDISIRFGELLGYPMELILHKVDSETRIDPYVIDC
ncbi:MAG: hypothetical protein RR232_05690 [Clostridia bacterium]